MNAAMLLREQSRGSGIVSDDRCDPSTPFTTWEIALDRVELDVMRAERDLARSGELPVDLRIDRWDVPANYGPLPVALRERAEQILIRQQACLRTMAERLGAVGRQQAVVEAVDAATSTSSNSPIYVERYI